VDVLFIDEVSLIDAALFALVDRRLQLIRGNRNPFGGVRLVVAEHAAPPVVLLNVTD
jgi:hypothetical protein